MMLRNRSRRAVTTTQTSLMADQPQSSQTQIGHLPNPTPTLSSLFASPKFKLFTSRITPFDSDFALVSPTSILDANPSIFSPKHDKPISYFEPTIPKPQRFQPPEAFGLADLVSNRSTVSHSTKPVSKMVMFGSKLRVQTPSADFGTKSGGPRYLPHGQDNSCVQTRVLTGCSISVNEMELSEDYTCVTSHGPNPTTRHIFDNFVIVESNCSVSPPPPPIQEANNRANDSFLSFCFTCKKNLDEKQDIYIYRGEKAFCSSECRSEEMLIDEMDS